MSTLGRRLAQAEAQTHRLWDTEMATKLRQAWAYFSTFNAKVHQQRCLLESCICLTPDEVARAVPAGYPEDTRPVVTTLLNEIRGHK